MSQYVATEPLYVGLARAYNAGDSVTAKQLEQHPEWKDKVEVATDDAAPSVAAPAPASVEDVLKEVGDDKDKAQQVLDAELGAEKPRKTLVAALQALLSD